MAQAGKRISRHLSRAAFAATCIAIAAPLATGASLPELDQLIEARDLICHFRKAGASPAPFPRRGPEFDMMQVIEKIDAVAKTARSVSTSSVGRKSLSVYRTDTRVHFVQRLERSVVVTTVEACETWRTKRGIESCTRYRALNAWHFDQTVHLDPDASFLKLPGVSYTGHCEPWYLD